MKNRPRKKRGVSSLIATVLLVAFSIALAAIVSTYLVSQAKKFKPEVFLEDTEFCDSVTIALELTSTDPENIKTNVRLSNLLWGSANDKLFTGFNITNKGSFSIHNLTISSPGFSNIDYPILDKIGDNLLKSTIIKPGGSHEIKIAVKHEKDPNADHQIKVIPWIKDNRTGQSVICTKRKLIFNYEEVCKRVRFEAGLQGENDPCPD